MVKKSEITNLSEDALCEEFAEALWADKAFQNWVLGFTKFAGQECKLLRLEQEPGRMKWWHHWWTSMPGMKHSETDVFATFAHPDGSRFALHIENKLVHSKWTIDQAQNYRIRASFMAEKAKFMNYRDYAVLLIAPGSFISRHSGMKGYFDAIITHEAIAEYVPAYRHSHWPQAPSSLSNSALNSAAA